MARHYEEFKAYLDRLDRTDGVYWAEIAEEFVADGRAVPGISGEALRKAWLRVHEAMQPKPPKRPKPLPVSEWLTVHGGAETDAEVKAQPGVNPDAITPPAENNAGPDDQIFEQFPDVATTSRQKRGMKEDG